MAIGPVLFVPYEPHVNAVTGHGLFDKNYLAFRMCQGLAFCRIFLHQEIFQRYVLILSFHDVNIEY
jgi:hypothetical protein